MNRARYSGKIKDICNKPGELCKIYLPPLTELAVMNKSGPIIMIEDDMEDQEIMGVIFKTLKYDNEIIYFSDGNKALEYLDRTDVQPFLILSDINMPKISGFELRNKVFTNAQLQSKCIPYLFFTTAADRKSVVDAYALSVQGFFKKPSSIDELESTIRKIVEYWKECIAPSQFS
jgi:response regulator RpfG family c-di-GMP phosphodiesterase